MDTNVVISSLFGGKPREVMNLWWQGRMVLCVSEKILSEYLEVLARFLVPTVEDVGDLLAIFRDRERVLVVEPRERVREVTADPADNMFLECAVAAGAQTIVSGDEHLLRLQQFRGIPILSPGDFLASLGDRL